MTYYKIIPKSASWLAYTIVRIHYFSFVSHLYLVSNFCCFYRLALCWYFWCTICVGLSCKINQQSSVLITQERVRHFQFSIFYQIDLLVNCSSLPVSYMTTLRELIFAELIFTMRGTNFYFTELIFAVDTRFFYRNSFFFLGIFEIFWQNRILRN